MRIKRKVVMPLQHGTFSNQTGKQVEVMITFDNVVRLEELQN